MHVLSISSLEEIPEDYIVISCGISGGKFEEYLNFMRENYRDQLCMWLSPIKRIFTLPDYSGQGKNITDCEVEEWKRKYKPKFSQVLCTNYIFIPETPAVILFDDVFSLQKKVEAAKRCDIPLLAIDTKYNSFMI